MSAAQVTGTLLRFPGGEHVAAAATTETLTETARGWHRDAQAQHFSASVALARGDLDAAVAAMVHERARLDQALTIAKEARGLPRGKRALERVAMQLILVAVSDELDFLPCVTAADTANTLESAAERLDNVQARLLNMAEGYRLTADSDRDESPE